jgi:hypothetical protein
MDEIDPLSTTASATGSREAVVKLETSAVSTVDGLRNDLEAMLASERYVSSTWLRLEPNVLEQSRHLVSHVRTFLQELDTFVLHERGTKMFTC